MGTPPSSNFISLIFVSFVFALSLLFFRYFLCFYMFRLLFLYKFVKGEEIPLCMCSLPIQFIYFLLSLLVHIFPFL